MTLGCGDLGFCGDCDGDFGEEVDQGEVVSIVKQP